VARRNQRTFLVVTAATLALTLVGCGNGRPPGIAEQPGENYVELSDFAGELVGGTELKVKVHYRFPDGLPHPDARFCFLFEVNEGKSGTIPVRKQGRELSDDGDLEASTSAVFLRQKNVSFGVKVQQSLDKGVTWRDVSEKLNYAP
jgi:hypothetical protein